MKANAKSFVPLFREYLSIFLPKQRDVSEHTITATKHTWHMLLNYVCKTTDKKVEKLTFDDLDSEIVTGFLDTYQQERGWVAATRNHRLGCIRSFFRYATLRDRTLVIYLEGLRGIALQKGPDKSFVLEYMEPKAVSAILHQPVLTTKRGLRDGFFLSLMYDAAARDCELLSMKFNYFDKIRKEVYLLGKGRKPRFVPVNQETIDLFQHYAKVYHPPGSDGNRLMFYTKRHGEITPMSDDCVAKFLQKYADAAKLKCSDVPARVNPHLIRKSRAMKLYRDGMPLEALAQLLGHKKPETTLIYARADTEMKRRAIENAETSSSCSVSQPVQTKALWEGNEELIKKLCGLE